MLNRGIIQPGVSPWASPVVLAKKNDNTDCLCVGFCRLNLVTRKDSPGFARMDDAISTTS